MTTSPNPDSHVNAFANPLFDLPERPRRNRRTASVRALVRETLISPQHFILPLFVMEGQNQEIPIKAMPGVSRLTLDRIVQAAKEAHALGISAVALFPVIPDSKKDPVATESTHANGLLQNTVKAIKDAVPALTVITDVAMDPYSTDGHDGLVRDGRILNDETLPILAAMAIAQAKAGADIVAPSDMMDGRVGYMRQALDDNGFTEVGILAYTAKYASSFYGPFREALDSAPRHGDKKTYQMDPANRREALREARLDVMEGADMVMVKPALPYLDIISDLRQQVDVPIAAYQVSGEYSMIQAAAAAGYIDAKAVTLESLTAIRRAGADMILTYAARQAAQWLHG
jgi:porphobilinogen synthase